MIYVLSLKQQYNKYIVLRWVNTYNFILSLICLPLIQIAKDV